MTDTQETTKMGKVTAGAKHLFGTLKSAAQKGQTAWKVTKAGVKTAVAATVVGTGVHVYNQFHKTPEEAHEDTVKMTQKVKNEVEDISQSWGMTNDNSVVQKTAKEGLKEVAGAGARHGGALREWIIKRMNKDK